MREINIELPDGTAKKRDYVENGEWDLVKSVAFVDSERYAQFQIQLILARRSTLLVLITILPTVLLSALNAMVFILPPESGERISFTLTLLLALAVFFTIMSDNIPKSSSPMPILSYLIGLQLLMGGIICFVTVINLYVYYKDQQDAIPACFSLNCLRHPNRDIMSADQSSAGDAHVHNGHCQTPSTVKYSDWKSSTDMIPSTDLKLLFSRVNNESSGDKPRLEGSDTNRRLTTPDRISSSPRMTWKKISIYVDRIMFIISFIYCLVVTVVVLYILQVGDR